MALKNWADIWGDIWGEIWEVEGGGGPGPSIGSAIRKLLLLKKIKK